LATLGGEELPLHKLNSSPRIFTICSDEKADFTACKLIARHTGGTFFNLSPSAGGPTSIHSSVQQICGAQEFAYLGATHDGQMEDMYALVLTGPRPSLTALVAEHHLGLRPLPAISLLSRGELKPIPNLVTY